MGDILLSSDHNPDIFSYPGNFSGNKKVLGFVSAACLVLMTMASISLYSFRVDFTLPILILAVLITFTLIMVSWRGEDP